MLFLPQLSKSWDYRHAQPRSEGIKSLQFFVFIIVCMECCVCAHVCAYTCVHAIPHISRPKNNLVESLFFFLPLHRFWRPHSAARLACQLPSLIGPSCQLDLAATGQTAGRRAAKLLYRSPHFTPRLCLPSPLLLVSGSPLYLLTSIE